MLTKPNHSFSLSSDGLFADVLPAITAYSLRKQQPWFLWKETAPFIRRFWIKRFGSNIMCIFTITWFHNSTVAHPFLIGFKSMTIASIQDFPMETFEHAFEIDVEHAEFHSYFSSVFFFFFPLKWLSCYSGRAWWLNIPAKVLTALEAAGSPPWAPLVY